MRLYKNALKKGWQLTSKNSWLWFFGLFAFFIGGYGGEYDFYFKKINNLLEGKSLLSSFNLKLIASLYAADNLSFLLLSLIFCIAICVFIYFVIISQISLIHSTRSSKKKISFSTCLNESRQYLWSVLAVNFISKFIITLILLLVAWPIFKITNHQNNLNNQIYFFLSIFISIPLVLIIAFINKYAINYIVFQKAKINTAIKDAFKLFIKNWLVTIEMAFVVFVISLLLGAFLLLATGVIMSPFLLSSLTGVYNNSLTSFFTVLMVGCFILIISAILIAAIFSTWQWTSWSYLFQELTKGNKQGKLLRVLSEDKK